MNAASTRRPPLWSDAAIRGLLDSKSCPVCGAPDIREQQCTRCNADFTGAIGADLWEASQAAVAALRLRQSVLERVPLAAGAAAAAPRPAAADPTAAPAASVLPRESAPRSSATVQSVLAVAGAGLLAIAAIVFTFFNPDLTDVVLRSLIVAVITLVFLVGAWALAARRLQFSAEAVGALGMVFLGLDVYSISETTPPHLSPWVFAAIGTLVGGGLMAVLGIAFRIRVWVLTSLLALAFVPAMLGVAGGPGLGAVAGWLGAAGAAFALIEVAGRLTARFDSGLRAERGALTAVQLLSVLFALLQVWSVPPSSPPAFWLLLSAVLLTVTVLGASSAQHPAGGFWNFLAGAAGVGAIALLPLTLSGAVAAEWFLSLVPAAAAVALIGTAARLRRPHRLRRGAVIGGSLFAVAMTALAPLASAAFIGASTVLGYAPISSTPTVASATIGLAALAAGLGVFAVLTPGARWIGQLGAWFAVAAALTLLCSPGILLWGRIAIGLGLSIAVCIALVRIPQLRDAAASSRLPVIIGAHLLVVLCGILSWSRSDAVVWAGVAIVGTTVALARTVPAPVRFLHVGIAYAYALVIFATALDLLRVEPVALLCLTTTVGGLGAIAATFLPRVTPRSWYAVLAVTSVPFVIGVAQVVFERSGWTALSTSVIFALALALVVTRRAGLGTPLRTLSAGLLIPSLAVVAVCLGAQLLLVSGSPVVLPVIATIVAVALPSGAAIQRTLAGRIGSTDAAAARIAIEASALLTAGIAVALSLSRDAAGLPTAFLVLVILGVGAGATSLLAGRRYGWWLAGAAFTGALWCVWGIAGVAQFEPYLLPPTLIAALIGGVLTARARHGLPLYATGLAAAAIPLLAALAIAGSDGAPWRGYGLVAASWVLLAVGALMGRGYAPWQKRLRVLRAPTLAVAIVTAAGGAVQAARWGLGLDSTPVIAAPLVLVSAGLGAAGAASAVLAARLLRTASVPTARLAQTRWLYAPAAVYVGAAAWPSIERDWFTIWAMWLLMLAFLVFMVVTAARARARTTSLPPVLFVFLLAFVTAMVAWSPRDLRVEWFSLPLGLFLLAAGALGMRGDAAPAHGVLVTLRRWPHGSVGSWALLAPGLVTVFSASMAATFTDPLTWRAILVIVLALVAILVGASIRLAAPFLIGIVVLPVENAIAFLVQIGRGIESMPWWITLSVVGAVLLIIAVTYERRAGESTGISARLRDLT